MPTIPAQFAVLDNRANTQRIAWTPLANSDDGAARDLAGPGRLITASVRGTFGAGGSVTLQGSADGVAWAALIQANNSAATFTAAGTAALRGNPRFIRPVVTAGDGTTALTVTLHVARA